MELGIFLGPGFSHQPSFETYVIICYCVVSYYDNLLVSCECSECFSGLFVYLSAGFYNYNYSNQQV